MDYPETCKLKKSHTTISCNCGDYNITRVIIEISSAKCWRDSKKKESHQSEVIEVAKLFPCFKTGHPLQSWFSAPSIPFVRPCCCTIFKYSRICSRCSGVNFGSRASRSFLLHSANSLASCKCFRPSRWSRAPASSNMFFWILKKPT